MKKLFIIMLTAIAFGGNIAAETPEFENLMNKISDEVSRNIVPQSPARRLKKAQGITNKIIAKYGTIMSSTAKESQKKIRSYS